MKPTPRPPGSFRRSQAITTWGPGALVDLPEDSIIVGGLDDWPDPATLERVVEPRLCAKIQLQLGVQSPGLFAPPVLETRPDGPSPGITGWRFPNWFLVIEKGQTKRDGRSRRLVHAERLDKKRRHFDKETVVPIRFVQACPKGHVSDIDWPKFVHQGTEIDPEAGPEAPTQKAAGCVGGELHLDEPGSSGDLTEMRVRCSCGRSRNLGDALDFHSRALGTCRGERPWLAEDDPEPCGLPNRLLTRSASNAHFPQALSVLSIPAEKGELAATVAALWEKLRIVDEPAELKFVRKDAEVDRRLSPFDAADVMKAIAKHREAATDDRDIKEVEIDAFIRAPEGYDDTQPVAPDFHARRLPEADWRTSDRSAGIAAVVQLHRLREVTALLGFSRFEAVSTGVNGELDATSDVQPAPLALDPTWFPAIENRGEGVFLLIDEDRLAAWAERPAVKDRVDQLLAGHDEFQARRRGSKAPPGDKGGPEFPRGSYVMLHTLAHLLIQSLSLRCGYAASSLKERIYRQKGVGHGLLLYTATPDAEGTLGGLVGQARHIEEHLLHALRGGSLCSHDPGCAENDPARGPSQSLLQGAACHGCCLMAETSCERGNRYLDRALVVPTVACPDAAFFRSPL